MSESWLTITPESGGSKTSTTSTILKITASKNTGTARSSTLIFKTSSGVSKTMTISQEVGETTYKIYANKSTTATAAGGSAQLGNNSEILIDRYIGDEKQSTVNPFTSGLLVSATSNSDWCRVTGYSSGKVNYYVDSRGTTLGSERTATITFTFYNPDDKSKVLTIDYPLVQAANTISGQKFVEFEFIAIDQEYPSSSSKYINPYATEMEIYSRVKQTYSSGESSTTLLTGEDCAQFVVSNNITLASTTDSKGGSLNHDTDLGIMTLQTSGASVYQTSGLSSISIDGYSETWLAVSYTFNIPASVSDTGAAKTYIAYRLIPQVKKVDQYVCYYQINSSTKLPSLWVPKNYTGYIAKVCGIGTTVGVTTSGLYFTTSFTTTKTLLTTTLKSITSIDPEGDGLYEAVPWTGYISTVATSSSSVINFPYYLLVNVTNRAECKLWLGITRTPTTTAQRISNGSSISTVTSYEFTEDGTAYFSYCFDSNSHTINYIQTGTDSHFIVYYSYNGTEYDKLNGGGVIAISTTTTNKFLTFKVVATQTTSASSSYLSVSPSISVVTNRWTINITAKKVKTSIRTTGCLYVYKGYVSIEDGQYAGLLIETSAGNQYVLGYGVYDSEDPFDILATPNPIETDGTPIVQFMIGRCYDSDDPTDPSMYELCNISMTDGGASCLRYLSESDYSDNNYYADYYLQPSGSEAIQDISGGGDEEDGTIHNVGEEVWEFDLSSNTPFELSPYE